MRPAWTRFGLSLLGLCFWPLTARAQGASEPLPPPNVRPDPALARVEPLPPVPLEALRPRSAPSPQWDLGLSAGICGVGQSSLWQGTRFCGGAIVDVTFLRAREADAGLGGYASVFTTGFFDGRYGMGALGLMPLGDLFVGQASAGPYLHSDGAGVSLGVEGNVSLGLRTLNPRGHYGHAHALVLGVAHTPGSDSRGGTTLSITLRVDAFWLGMPFGRLF